MKIQINTDNNIHLSQELENFYKDMLAGELDRFEEQATTIIMHLSNENGNKGGEDNVRCLLEARLEGLEPSAVTAHADNPEQAAIKAIEKLTSSLSSTIGKLRDRQ